MLSHHRYQSSKANWLEPKIFKTESKINFPSLEVDCLKYSVLIIESYNKVANGVVYTIQDIEKSKHCNHNAGPRT